MFGPTQIDTSKMIVSIVEKEKHLLIVLLEANLDKLKKQPNEGFVSQKIADHEELISKLSFA